MLWYDTWMKNLEVWTRGKGKDVLCNNNATVYYMVYRPQGSVGHTLQNLIYFANIFIFKPLNPSIPTKRSWNRFTFARPICPYAGLHVSPIDSKVMADCRACHYTSPCFMYLHTVVQSPLPLKLTGGKKRGHNK